MTSQSPLTWPLRPRPHPALTAARDLIASSLRRASAALERLATHVAAAPAQRLDGLDTLEFHAESGAPEGGALYLDGRLVGWLQGVHRL